MNNNNPIWNSSEDQISAVHSLLGRTLKTGWVVTEKAVSKPGSTGGNFSVCYEVEKEGQQGFLKALNVLSFLRDDESDMLNAMTAMLNTYTYERDILIKCKNSNLSKVSKLLEASMENIPGFLVANVYYMIFERADSDVRNHINFTQLVDDAWKLRSLHNIATGLRQLHSIEISHQDIKPSNIFIYKSKTSKIGDLGRSLCKSVLSPHSSLNFAGDQRYAPPEVFHGYVLPDWKDKVFAIDCFMLGSMATYYFTGQNMIALLSQQIDPSINILTMNFDNALPYWIDAFESCLNVIDTHLSDFDEKNKLLGIIRMLCYPDPKNRGHWKNIEQKGSSFQLERFVQLFNLMATKAELKLTK